MDKLIFTIDLDAFFISCEEIRQPKIKGKPAVVAWEINGKGVASTANYKARELGIHGGMPLFKAIKLERNLVIIKPDYEFYEKMANEVFSIVGRYSNLMEISSVDECFVDLTHLAKKTKPIELAKKIKREILSVTGLVVSIGISTNLWLSKMASSMDKPNGITTLWAHEIKEKLWPHKIRRLYMVGEATSKIFNDHNILTIGELAKLKNNHQNYSILKNNFGINLNKYIDMANGNLVKEINSSNNANKSISKEKTLMNNIFSIDDIKKEIRKLLEVTFEKANRRKLSPDTIHISLKKEKTFSKISASKKIGHNNNSWDELWYESQSLVEKLYIQGTVIKQIGVKLEGLKERERIYRQKSIDEKECLRVNELQDLSDKISLTTQTDVFVGETMKNNKKFEKRKHMDSNSIKFKTWGD